MKIHSIDTGLFKLDGGAMFGVVPRSMWQKLNPPDANNMCTWAMRCLLIEDGGRLLLIDNGIGDKQDEKFRGHFFLHGDDTLEKSLRKLGFSSTDITDVFLTHLHFDHCGGSVQRRPDGAMQLAFPDFGVVNLAQVPAGHFEHERGHGMPEGRFFARRHEQQYRI